VVRVYGPVLLPEHDWLTDVTAGTVVAALPAPAVGVEVHEAGGVAGGAMGAVLIGWVVMPLAVVSWAEVASSDPGHQATKIWSAKLACTSSPSLRTTVTAVTPGCVSPSTRV
jgi:hypothetical protein